MYILISQQCKFRLYKESYSIPSLLGNFVNLEGKKTHDIILCLHASVVSDL